MKKQLLIIALIILAIWAISSTYNSGEIYEGSTIDRYPSRESYMQTLNVSAYK